MNVPGQIRAYLDSIDGDEKFLITLGAGMVNTLLVWFGKIPSSDYVALTTITIGAFLAAKTYSEVKNRESSERETIAGGEPK